MGRHCFNLDGGEDLTTMGATWFVSYAYYTYVDKSHMNWNRVSTSASRISVFNRSGSYYEYWLKEILVMEDLNLNKNSIDLKSAQVKQMAMEILAKMK